MLGNGFLIPSGPLRERLGSILRAECIVINGSKNLAFENKVNNYLNSFFGNEISFFEKTYKFKINIITDNSLIIPEYKIHLFNKNKKLINKIESVKNIEKKLSNNIIKVSKIKKFKTEEEKNNKKSNKGLGKTLWVRRKKAKSN